MNNYNNQRNTYNNKIKIRNKSYQKNKGSSSSSSNFNSKMEAKVN